MLSGCAHARQPACEASRSDGAEIERVVQAFYDALRKEDEETFQRLTTSSFYSFDGGKRYAGVELVKLVRDARARGVELNWSVGPLDTHVGCGMAWATWENVGSAGVPPQVQPVRWLESAVLVRQGNAWKIDFFHSTRAAASQ
jgi:hypothetical protein